MAARKKKFQINLLPQAAAVTTTAGRVLVWVLSTFRIIVIVTEIIVLLAFLSRFFLDVQNSDLNELIKQKQAVVAASIDFEKDFKDAQERLELFSQLTSEENLVNPTLDSIVGYMPPEILLNSIILAEGNIKLYGYSASERGIQQFIVNLKSSDLFEKVVLLTIESDKTDPTLSFFRINIIPKG